MVAWVIGGSVLCVALAAGAVARRRAKRASHPTSSEFGPIRPAVRLLTSDEDLRAAIERAVAYERVTADRTTARIDRYYRIVDEQPERVRARAELLDFDSSAGPITAER